MNPEREAIIIREHARLREEIVDWPLPGKPMMIMQDVSGEEVWVRRADVLALLHGVERDKQ
jgi:hypothetical protein